MQKYLFLLIFSKKKLKHNNDWNITETDDYNWNWDINTVSGNTYETSLTQT